MPVVSGQAELGYLVSENSDEWIHHDIVQVVHESADHYMTKISEVEGS